VAAIRGFVQKGRLTIDAVREAVKYNWLSALLGAGALTGCEINPPQIPSTNFQISIPVADERTTVQDLAANARRRRRIRKKLKRIGDGESRFRRNTCRDSVNVSFSG
jgi:hypothetical protein